MKMWSNIQKRKAASPVPSLIHKDLDISLRAIRDLFTQDVERVVVDSREEYQKILEFCETFMPQLKSFVDRALRKGRTPLRLLRNRNGDQPGPGPEDLAEIGRIHRDRPDRSADGDRREHRALCRESGTWKIPF
jgi:hypothetical protein